ncbi:Hypothetical protein CINCED_3A008172 [Cinara cedri]|uniref:Uncharacterized protein n=1 Tax=Cinara cedri TaxID=506608 RepID=A0A5E4NKX1_9HEMI|nr:Hypothetical protein CINCED_3A008172 [Cinara cedri]
MLSLKGILIITSWTICIALTSIYGVYSADKKQFEKDNIKQSQSSLITKGSQEVNRFDLHKTEQEMDEDEDDDIISDISNNKQFEKAEFIMERLKELTGETKDERVQDDNINRNDDYDLDGK